ncbi:hypothetical protein, conserved [Eimeria brunetti]|uniref:Sas10 C-terminal domain-containing protein n=1 Tax=Eimeria brunetti TaxID=51314 RepID=U6LQD2_9EIME|nr:hypothetical protein, conserved [Eimeria brunetti]
MAKAKRGVGRRPAARPRASSEAQGTAKKGPSGPPAAAADEGYMSDGSDEFIPLDGHRESEDSSEEEREMMRHMGLEGAEHAASEEEEEEEEEGSEDEDEDEEGEDKEGSASGGEEGDGGSSDSDLGESRTAWGRRAKNFYGGSSSSDSSSDEEEIKEKMKEAVRVAEVEDVEGMTAADFGADARSLAALQQLLALQQKGSKQQQLLLPLQQGKEETEKEMLWKARLDAEVEAILDGFAASSEQQQQQQQQQKQQLAAAGLSEEQLQQLVATAHPELQGLLQELQETLKEINNKVHPLVSLAKSKNFLTKEVGQLYRQLTNCGFPRGVSLLDAKNQLLLSYLVYLSYYILLKAHGAPVGAHPVIERLIETRLLLQKFKPLETSLKPHLDRLYTQQMDSRAAAAAPRARLDEFAAVGDSDDEEQQQQQQQQQQESGEEGSTESGGSEEEGEKTRKYKPPKMMFMEYTAEKSSAQTRALKELQRAAKRLQKSQLVKAVREGALGAPEEVGVERFEAAQQQQAAARRLGLGGPFRGLGPAAAAAAAAAGAAAGDGDDEEEFELMRRSLSKKGRKAQAAQRALYERRAAAAVGSTLEDLAVFYENPLGEDGENEEYGEGLNKKGKRSKSRGVLGHYLNAAKQAAEEAKKAHKAEAQKLILAREQNLQHLSRKQIKENYKQSLKTPDKMESDDEEFAALAAESKKKKADKKQRIKEKALSFLPEIEEEVDGQRPITREIKTNRGLVRKRKKFEGNARVHNRMKYQQKAKKLKSMRQEMRPVEDSTYMGEASGIRSNLKRSRTLH